METNNVSSGDFLGLEHERRQGKKSSVVDKKV